VPLKPRKSFKALKASWTRFTRNKTTNVVKLLKTKGSGKTFGKRPTRLLRTSNKKLLICSVNLKSFALLMKQRQ
jgi:hypothetical protein